MIFNPTEMEPTKRQKLNRLLTAYLKVLLLFSYLAIPVVAHLIYSRYGFNAVSDDGFILAVSRRLLNGEIPHRDFISIRPVGSGILHIPEILFGGSYATYISRFVYWLEFLLIAYFGVEVILHFFKTKINPATKYLIVLLTFLFLSQNFPLFVWHTTDGIAAYVLGLYLVTRQSEKSKLAGYFLIGFSPLCKQNFLPMLPLTLLLLNDWKSVRYWVAGFLPGILYLTVVNLAGGLGEFAVQMGVQSDLMRYGVKSYQARLDFLQGIGSGLLVTAIEALSYRLRIKSKEINLSLFLVIAYLVFIIYRASITLDVGFFIFGLSAGVATITLFRKQFKQALVIALFLLLGWCSSISMGANTPGLVIGLLIASILILVFRDLQNEKLLNPVLLNLVFLAFLAALFFKAFYIFDLQRKNNIYGDPPASQLTHYVDLYYPGSRGILTGEKNYQLIKELNDNINKVGNKKFAILPDFPGYWIGSKQRNPLPAVWALDQELGDAGVDRMEKAIIKFTEDGGSIILMKYKNIVYRSLIGYVAENCEKVSETESFWIFKNCKQK